MPGAYLPVNPATGEMYYTQDELSVLRLSSKSHWDIPLKVGGNEIIHVLQSHPIPPVFDDGTATEYPPTKAIVDWNGFKNSKFNHVSKRLKRRIHAEVLVDDGLSQNLLDR